MRRDLQDGVRKPPELSVGTISCGMRDDFLAVSIRFLLVLELSWASKTHNFIIRAARVVRPSSPLYNLSCHNLKIM
jgi:hypothetical protein